MFSIFDENFLGTQAYRKNLDMSYEDQSEFV